jgi:glutamyl-tRNA synthetase
MEVTRLAPSPTGALHLGNARTFLVNWALARRRGWQVALRIEDLDGPRVKRGADLAALEDLRWLGINWDAGPVRQSERAALYQAAADRLVAAGSAYPCVCTRKEVESAASAPHAEDGSAVYPGTCRGRFASVAAARAATGREPAIRFQVPSDESAVVTWCDAFRGTQCIDARNLGDFVIAKADRTAAYQLAVVVDDADAGVTQVVRGDDLVDSTPRQMLLYRALGLSERIPTYAHLPLVTGPDGRRLAKRHGDTRLSYYRSLGVQAGRVVALLARWCAVRAAGASCSAEDFSGGLVLDAIPPSPVVMNMDDEQFLRGKVAGPAS